MGAGDCFPVYIQAHVGPGGKSPFYQLDVHALDLQAGNTAGMYTAAAVVVVRILGGECGAVRVSRGSECGSP